MARQEITTKEITKNISVTELRFNLPATNNITANAIVEISLKDENDNNFDTEKVNIYLQHNDIVALSAFVEGYNQLKTLIYNKFDEEMQRRADAAAAAAKAIP